jgi:hypothetical protein
MNKDVWQAQSTSIFKCFDGEERTECARKIKLRTLRRTGTHVALRQTSNT